MALADLNGDGSPDLIVTRINENVLALVNRGAPGGHSFTVKLNGVTGNPDAIGARIVVRFKNGNAQAAELAAGSGYLSQSEPLAFFGYTSSNPPQSIEIVWPDGSRTSHPFKSGAVHVVLQKSSPSD